jgi:hypothetical protein
MPRRIRTFQPRTLPIVNPPTPPKKKGTPLIEKPEIEPKATFALIVELAKKDIRSCKICNKVAEAVLDEGSIFYNLCWLCVKMVRDYVTEKNEKLPNTTVILSTR